MGIFVPGLFAGGIVGCASPAPTASPSPSPAPTASPPPATAPADDTPSAGGNGEFISRVFATGEVAPIDPIMAPGGVAPHTHVFFGANNVTATSTRTQLEAQPTSAQNPSDTAAYWVPEVFFNGTLQMPGCTGSPPNMTCGSDPSTTLNVRVYYTASQPATTVQLPRIMAVTGYPAATRDPHRDDPTSLMRVHYHCGADKADGFITPTSRWPYTCTPYAHADFDGVVMIVDFPECWNGNVSGSMNGERMVKYIDPNVDPTVDPMTNDLAYANSDGSCPADHSLPIPKVSIHVHPKVVNPSSDGSTIFPSSCAGQSGFPFMCQSQHDDPPATGPGSIGLGLSSDAGTPGGWYTLHADFVQSWQMGTVTGQFSKQPPPNQDANEMPGTLNDLTEDCLNAGITCSFQPKADGSFIGG